jgi:hypothetical protein
MARKGGEDVNIIKRVLEPFDELNEILGPFGGIAFSIFWIFRLATEVSKWLRKRKNGGK